MKPLLCGGPIHGSYYAAVFRRPDGRRFVRSPDDVVPGEELYADVDERDANTVRAFAELGFVFNRREQEYVLPTRCERTGPPPGIAFETADRVPEDALRELDDTLRQDVPGTDGWRWDAADFHGETYESPHFDPALYLVAVDEEAGSHVAIVRVWNRPDVPKLGFVGVLRPYRQRGIGRALVTEVLERLAERGVPEVTTTIDETNTASRGLLEGLGARPVGSMLELVRRP